MILKSKHQTLSIDGRLEYQTYIGPLMDNFKQWLEEQLSEKKAESNSGLG